MDRGTIHAEPDRLFLRRSSVDEDNWIRRRSHREELHSPGLFLVVATDRIPVLCHCWIYSRMEDALTGTVSLNVFL